MAAFAKDIEFLGTRFFMPASLSALVFGVALVLYSPGLAFSDTWVWLGLVGFGATFVTGAFFLGPRSGRLGSMIDTHSADDPAVQRGIREIFLISRIDQLVLALVVADMVFKPGT
jgi:hypothetical protein